MVCSEPKTGSTIVGNFCDEHMPKQSERPDLIRRADVHAMYEKLREDSSHDLVPHSAVEARIDAIPAVKMPDEIVHIRKDDNNRCIATYGNQRQTKEWGKVTCPLCLTYRDTTDGDPLREPDKPIDEPLVVHKYDNSQCVCWCDDPKARVTSRWDDVTCGACLSKRKDDIPGNVIWAKDQCCRNCHFCGYSWHPMCRRNAPDRSNDGNAQWPIVQWDDWCGDWRQK